MTYLQEIKRTPSTAPQEEELHERIREQLEESRSSFIPNAFRRRSRTSFQNESRSQISPPLSNNEEVVQPRHANTNKPLSKCLAHILIQLQKRPMPPPVFDEFKPSGEVGSEKGLGAIVETVKGAVKSRNGKWEPPTLSGEEEEEDSADVFTTDATYDLMSQLKEVLVISTARGWEIFHDGRYGNMSIGLQFLFDEKF